MQGLLHHPLAAAAAASSNPIAPAVVAGLLLLLLTVGFFALRIWYRNSIGLTSREETLPTAEQRDLISLVHVAKFASEQTAELQRERAVRLRTQSALDQNQTLLERTLAERLRLGRELHDDTCQVLYGVTLHLDALRTLVAQRAPDLEPGVARSLDQLRSLNRKVRSYVDQLEAEPLPTATLRSLMLEAAAPFAGLPNLQLHIEIPADGAALPASSAEDLVAIAREAVSNAVRHGRAMRIVMRSHEEKGSINLSITDDGSGFDPQTAAHGHGLANLSERAERLSGSIRWDSVPGKGTTVVLNFPKPSAP